MLDSTGGVAGSSSSLIILYQLQDKLEAHTRFVHFLTDVGLFDKVRGGEGQGGGGQGGRYIIDQKIFICRNVNFSRLLLSVH